MALQIEEPGNKSNFALFALGFRPFFLLAAFSATLLITLWLLQLLGKITLSSYYSPTGWHAHEMLFGYTMAVIAGFLLTAAGNWTGIKIVGGWRLGILVFVFISGRVAPFFSAIPYWLIVALDLSFIPLVALLIAIPIIKVKQWSNIIFIPLLFAMAAANLTVHLSTLNIIDTSIATGSRMMLYLIIFLIVVMGGRVIPFFTERGVGGAITKKWKWLEVLSPVSIISLGIADGVLSNAMLTGAIALFAATVNATRLYGWYSNRIWQVPLVWILHVAYAWIVVGFLLKALILLDSSMVIFSYHAFTVGGIGIMTLGMMARVSLGHTGREMKLNSWMVLAFILVNIAVLFRVILPVFLHDLYLQLIQVAGWLWTISFIIFLLTFTPMLIQPRVDGREE